MSQAPILPQIKKDSPTHSASLPELRLTRVITADPRCALIEKVLKDEKVPLWEKSSIRITRVPLHRSLETCLKQFIHRKQLQRGLENIDQFLSKEQRGLIAIREKEKKSPSLRVSRVLLISNDGSERFYRDCEKILVKNQDRLLIIQIDEPSKSLSQILLGPTILGAPDRPLKALLITDKDAVGHFFFSLLGNGSPSS
jgi:hypothetical protein